MAERNWSGTDWNSRNTWHTRRLYLINRITVKHEQKPCCLEVQARTPEIRRLVSNLCFEFSSFSLALNVNNMHSEYEIAYEHLAQYLSPTDLESVQMKLIIQVLFFYACIYYKKMFLSRNFCRTYSTQNNNEISNIQLSSFSWNDSFKKYISN